MENNWWHDNEINKYVQTYPKGCRTKSASFFMKEMIINEIVLTNLIACLQKNVKIVENNTRLWEDKMETEAVLEVSNKKGISGSTIKMIAIITMLIDHTAATILERMMSQNSFSGGEAGELLYTVYLVMRIIGRLGFPIFIFLLVEGLEHTHNRWKYLIRMVIFALVSEIPFDFAFNLSKAEIFSGKIIDFTYQNVFFTLSIGLFTIIGIQSVGRTQWKTVGKVFMNIGIALVGMAIAYFLRTDYGAIGVLAIVVMYLLRKNRMLASAITCVVLMFSSILEASAFLVLWPIGFYNGKRGWNLKWVFYIFYPAHLFVLWLICLAMGIA